jgi:thermostable 8-oxoguanine DNA glycosylase
MKKEEQNIETMKMVRAIRDKLSKLRRENPEEYFRRLDKRYEQAQAKRLQVT